MKKTKLIAIGATTAVALAMGTGLAACGDKKFDAEKAVTVVVREDGSGTKSAFMELIGLKGKADVSGAIVGTTTAAVLVEVSGNPYAIGYDSLGYVTDEVKTLKVDGVEATVANIKAGTYKVSRPLNIVYKAESLENELYGAFYTFLQSTTAQEIITEKGYVATYENPVAYSVNASLSGSIAISGSTSLQPLMTVLADKFEDLQSAVTVTVSGGGSGTGYGNAENGVSAFGMISESFTQTKAPSCTYYEVAKDGIAVIVNNSNTYDNITLEQLKNIYDCDGGDNAITKWSQLG